MEIKKESPKNKTIINEKFNDVKLIDKNAKRHSKKRLSLNFAPSKSAEVKAFEALINIKDDSIILNNNENKHNITFNINPKIKKKLMKDYKKAKKLEKKYRKIKIISNLVDSFQSSEESNEEDGIIGYNFYISSDSYFIFIFDSLLLFFSLFYILFIPLKLAEKKYFCKNDITIYIIFQYITEILYILDLFISFFRSYYDYEYKNITKFSQIVKHYLGNGFITDIISAFPLYMINRKLCENRYNNFNKYNLITSEILLNFCVILKIFKVFKVLNHNKNKIIELIYEIVSDYWFFEQIIDMLIYFFKIFSFFHILICVHIFLGEQSLPNWMVHINIQNENLLTKYISSFYFIIETMTTVGYGDILSVSFLEKCFQIILLSIGIVSYSFIVTKFGNYIMKKSKEDIELEEKKLQLEQIRINYPLMPFKLYIKIQEHFIQKTKNKKNKKNETKQLINELPEQLRNELSLIVNKNIIKNFNFFKNCGNTDFIIKTLSCLFQETFKKETILIKEGQLIESIIFVKDGRLILEATIDLIKPYESYQKYFKENFKYLKNNNDNNGINISQNNTNNQETNNFDNLKAKINYVIENIKLNIRNSPNTRRSSILSVIDKNNSDDEKKNSNKEEEKSEEEGKYHYLKILDIRKNEHFGNILMYLEKPAPLTLKVKSKIAEIFFLKKKDAFMISSLHHNIVKRINDKSYKNLLSIKKKTLQILKNYLNLSNFNKINIENKSWFNEKSKDVILQDITNFINNSINEINNKSNASINFQYKGSIKNGLAKSINNFNIKNSIINRSMNLLSCYKSPKIRKSPNKEKLSVISNKNRNYYPKIIIRSPNSSKKENNAINFNFSSESNSSDKDNKLHNQLNLQIESPPKNSNISPKLLNINNNIKQYTYSKFKVLNKNIANKDISDQDSLELTMEEEMLTLNNLKNDIDTKLRKRIKSSVKKNKILKLSKIQNNLINSYQEEINSSLLNDEINSKIINNFKKISELNNTIYNNLLEYMETEDESENEKKEKQNIDKNKYMNRFKIYKNTNFKIDASYYNINNLTKGLITKNEKYKTDIKYIIETYINKKKYHSLKEINEFINLYTRKKYREENILKKNTKKTEFNNLPHIDNLSFVFNNIINGNTKQNKKNYYIPKGPRHSKTKNFDINTPKFASNQIKKTKTNNINVYKNFKYMEYDGKSSKLNINNNRNKRKMNKYDFNYSLNENINQNDYDKKDEKDSLNIFNKIIGKVFSKLNLK